MSSTAIHALRRISLFAALLFLGISYPFVFESWPQKFPAASFWAPRFGVVDTISNVILFLPLGLIFGSVGRRAAFAALIGFLMSVGVEVIQHRAALRVPAVDDVVWNTVGTALGAFAYPRLKPVFAWRGWPSAGLAGFCLAAMVAIGISGPPKVEPTFWRWDSRAQLTVGRAPRGEAVWTGAVHRADLYASAYPPGAISEAPIWSYAEGSAASKKAPLPSLLKAGALTIDLVLSAPAKWDERSDAGAVLLYSDGFSRMNFAIGHLGSRLAFRLKTRVTPILGAKPGGIEPAAIAMPRAPRTRVTINYQKGITKIYINGELRKESAIALPNHNGARRLLLPRRSGPTWYAFGVALVLAALLGLRFDVRRSVFGALVVVLGIELLQCVQFTRGLQALPLLGGAFGALLGAWGIRSGRR